MKQLRHNKSSVTNINYHIVFCPKYRRKVLVNGIDQRLKEVLTDIAELCGCKIKSLEVMPDRVHLFIEGVPTKAVHLIVRDLKGKSSRILRSEFPELRSKLPNLWTRAYYCETIGCICEETVRKYIELQKSH